jgi:hypothetical protein
MKIRTFISILVISYFTTMINWNLYAQTIDKQQTRGYDVAAFYWPAYHPDYRFKEIKVFPDGKGEWEAIYKAKPKFAGHEVPKVPLWGYEDESDPSVMGKKIATAVKYGINVMIFDWYWYDNKPFLEDALNKGFLKAKNTKDMRFC